MEAELRPLPSSAVGVPEHPHPRTGLAGPVGRHPGPLAQLEAALGVGHDRQVAAVGRAERGDAQGTAVRVVRIGGGGLSRSGRRSGPGASPPATIQSRVAGSGTCSRPSPWATQTPKTEPSIPCSMMDGLLSMRTVVKRDSKRPESFWMNRGLSSSARSKPGMPEQRHQLAAVAHAQGEGVRPGEETAELLRQARVVADDRGPALGGIEHVAEGEPAHESDHVEAVEVDSAREQVGHGDVPGLEAGGEERPPPSPGRRCCLPRAGWRPWRAWPLGATGAPRDRRVGVEAQAIRAGSRLRRGARAIPRRRTPGFSAAARAGSSVSSQVACRPRTGSSRTTPLVEPRA